MNAIPGKNILLVDDNHDAVDMLATLLQVSGYSTDKAYDGYSACDAAKARMPNVIIMDIGMPWMDGFQAIRALRKIPGAANIPVIALSGNGNADTPKRASEAGFAKYFFKPLDFDSLSAYLENMP
jgi:CheY-like chemotaxis protein